VLVLTVCAVAARFSAHPHIEMVPKFLSGERWASRARRICTTRLDRPNLTLVTCLVLLSLHDFGTCHGARSWALGGQAIRMAFALRLHREDVHKHSFVNVQHGTTDFHPR
jgi:transcription factor-like protein